MNLTREERNSFLFYQGMVQYVSLEPSQEYLSEFYNIENGYEVLDLLLFPGLDSENVRLWIEQRSIDPMVLDHMEELLRIYCNLFSAMCRYTFLKPSHDIMRLYRKDRMLSWENLKDGMVNAFFLHLKNRGFHHFLPEKSIAFFWKKYLPRKKLCI